MKSVIVTDAATPAGHHALLLGENVIYLMGLSFVLGGFFTILVLILLDFMQRDRLNRE